MDVFYIVTFLSSRPQHTSVASCRTSRPGLYFGIQLEKSPSTTPTHCHKAVVLVCYHGDKRVKRRLLFWQPMLVLAGKRPTLRSSDSQTHTHTRSLSLRPCRPSGWGWWGWWGRSVCACVTVLSRRGWQWRDTGEIIMSPKQGWQGAARALQLSVNCH